MVLRSSAHCNWPRVSSPTAHPHGPCTFLECRGGARGWRVGGLGGRHGPHQLEWPTPIATPWPKMARYASAPYLPHVASLEGTAHGDLGDHFGSNGGPSIHVVGSLNNPLGGVAWLGWWCGIYYCRGHHAMVPHHTTFNHRSLVCQTFLQKTIVLF